MPQPDSLFDLIHSLSKSEKRYLKIAFSSNSGTKSRRYLALFDLMAGMEAFDPEHIQGVMAWTSYEKMYPVFKKYLQDKILDVLEGYFEQNDPKSRARKAARHVHVLLEKNRFQLASQKIRRFKRLALETEEFQALLELLQLERQLFIRDQGRVFQQADMLRIGDEIQFAIEGVLLRERAAVLNSRFFAALNKHGGESKELGISEAEHLLDEIKALGILDQPYFSPKILHYNTLGQFYYMKGDFLAAQAALGELLDLFAAQPRMTKVFARNYIGVLFNYGNRSLAANDYAAVFRTTRLLEGLKVKRQSTEAKRLESCFALGLGLVVNSGQSAYNLDFLQRLHTILLDAKSGISLRYQLNLKLVYAICLIQEENYSQALILVREVMAAAKPTALRAYARITPLLEMLIHFEMGNFDWLEYRIRNRLEGAKAEAAFGFEKHFLVFLREMIAGNPIQERESANRFLDALVLLQKDGREIAPFSVFNFETWAQAHAQGRSFQTLQRERWAAKGGIPVRLD